MDTTNSRTNFARVGDIVNEIFAKSLRDELSSKVPPTELRERLEGISKKKYKKHFKDEEEEVIENAILKNSYNEIDVSFLYILVRTLCLPEKPTNPCDQKFLRSINKMRKIRNKYIAHAIKNEIEHSIFVSIMLQCEDICKQLDERTRTTHFTEGLTDIRNRNMVIICDTTTSVESDEMMEELIKKEHIVREWKFDDLKFYETSACRYAEGLLQKNSVVNITGPSGCGKSAMAQHIALKFYAKGYGVIPVKDFQEFDHLVNPNRPYRQLYILHDPFGKEFTEKCLYGGYKRVEGNIKRYLKIDRIKVLLTCRVTIMNEQKDVDLLQKTVVPLHEFFLLSRDEKLSILQSHWPSCTKLSQGELKQILDTEHYFPLLCAMCGRNKSYQEMGSTFFTKPTEIIQKDINYLMKHKHRKYCGLILLVSANGCLNSDLSNIDEDTFQKVKKITCKHPCTDKMIISKELQSLVGFLLRKREDKFLFLHDFVSEVTTYVFGNSPNQGAFIDLCPISALRKMVFFSGDKSLKKDQELAVFLSDKQIEPMVDRYLNEFEENFFEICLCPSFRYQKVQRNFAEKISSIDDDKFERLFLAPCKTNEFMQLEFNHIKDVLTKMKNIINPRVLGLGLLRNVKDTNERDDHRLPFEKPLTRKKYAAVKKVFHILRSKPADDAKDFDFPETSVNYKLQVSDTTITGVQQIITFLDSLLQNNEFLDFFYHVSPPIQYNTRYRELFAKVVVIRSSLSDIMPILEEKLDCLVEKMSRILSDDENFQKYLFPYDTSGKSLTEECIDLLLSECNEKELNQIVCLCVDRLDIMTYTKIISEITSFLVKVLNIFSLESRQYLLSFICDVFDFHHQLGSFSIDEFIISLQELGLLDDILKRNESVYAHSNIQHLKTNVTQTTAAQLKNAMILCAHKNSPLLSCVIHAHSEVVDAVLKRARCANEKKIQKMSEYLLVASCISGSVKMFNLVYDFVGEKAFCQRWYFKGGILNALHISAALHYSNLTSSLLSRNFPVHSIDPLGNTALHMALKSFCRQMSEPERIRAVKTIQILLRHGGHTFVRDIHGATPFHRACEYVSDTNIFYHFMQYDLCINDSINNGHSLLSLASSNGNVEIVRSLINLGACINHKNCQGLTPLHSACIFGCTDTVNCLLSNGINENERDKFGITPIMYAAQNGNRKTVMLLLEKGVEVDTVDENSRTVLFHAVENDHFEIVEILCNHDANVNIADNKSLSPLSRAASKGYLKILNTLCCYGADVNNCDDMRETPLMMASKNNHIDVVEFLLEKHVEVNFQDTKLKTALFFSALEGNVEITEMLLNHNGEKNSCDENGITPHMAAAMNSKVNVLSILLEHGCDIDYRSKIGDTALILASRAGHNDIACLLIEKGSDINICNNHGECALWIAAAYGHIDIVRLLLDDNADLNICDAIGRTPLYIAALNGHSSTVRLLLEYGAFVDAVQQKNSSPLMIASGIGEDDIVEMLIDYDADINLRDQYGKTPLDFAMQGNRDTTVKILLQNNSDANFSDKEKLSLLMKAISMNKAKIIIHLLHHGAPFRVLIIVFEQHVAFCFPANKKVYFQPPRVPASTRLKKCIRYLKIKARNMANDMNITLRDILWFYYYLFLIYLSLRYLMFYVKEYIFEA